MLSSLTEELIGFIRSQTIFFVATAAPQGRVNVSPKGMDTLRVLAPNQIIWLNLTGSGNETAAHIAASRRMTLMFMSITAEPRIVRVFGTATIAHPRDPIWDPMIQHFPTLAGSRQIFDLSIDSVRTSCGTGVPIMTVDAARADTELEPFYAAMTPTELTDYWSRKNATSIDGYPTNIADAAID
jgi:hypothetical protein